MKYNIFKLDNMYAGEQYFSVPSVGLKLLKCNFWTNWPNPHNVSEYQDSWIQGWITENVPIFLLLLYFPAAFGFRFSKNLKERTINFSLITSRLSLSLIYSVPFKLNFGK